MHKFGTTPLCAQGNSPIVFCIHLSKLQPFKGNYAALEFLRRGLARGQVTIVALNFSACESMQDKMGIFFNKWDYLNKVALFVTDLLYMLTKYFCKTQTLLIK